MVTSFVATHLWQVRDVHGIEPSLKRQIGLSTLIMTPVAFIVCYYFLPNDGTFVIGTDAAAKNVKYWYVFFCVACGLWSGMAIGYITEYYTSHGWENGYVLSLFRPPSHDALSLVLCLY
jgi:Na+/H+-translocating membrane pyrophosphatase